MGRHPVHVSKTAIVVAQGISPFRVVLSLCPGCLCVKLDHSDIVDWVGCAAPRILEWSSPSFGDHGGFEHVVKSIFENAGIHSSVLIDESHGGPIHSVVFVGEGACIIRGCNGASRHQIVNPVGIVKIGGINERLNGEEL